MTQAFTHRKYEGTNNTDRINGGKGTAPARLLGNQSLTRIIQNASDPAPIQLTYIGHNDDVSYIGQENTAGEDRGESPAQAMDDIAAFYQWLPGNLVLGPPTKKRPYDGDDGFDCEAAYFREISISNKKQPDNLQNRQIIRPQAFVRLYS